MANQNITRRQVLQSGLAFLISSAIPSYAEEPEYKTKNFANDSDEVILARMLFGEARNCTELEKVAVAYTTLNRIDDGKKWNGETLREVILCPKQYSCFNENNPNRKELMNPEKYDKSSFEDCLRIARGVLEGKYQDPTNGATHYFNPKLANPSWARSRSMKKIGKIKISDGKYSAHEFYLED